MAITGGDRRLWLELRVRGLIPERPRVLEIGRANWYGDVPVADVVKDWEQFGDDVPYPRFSLTVWEMADWYYEFMLRRPSRTSIDLDPEAVKRGALHRDLNEPLPSRNPDLRNHFDIVINTGTAEHVFDQRRVWESMHDAAKPGALIVHSLPLWGWFNHGFFNYHPTFVEDVATENGYEILVWLLHEITTGWFARVGSSQDIAQHEHRAYRGHSAMMHVAFRKQQPAPFRVPMQGVYSERATLAEMQAWRTIR